MKVLFVSSGNSGKVSPIVKSQGESLHERGLQVDYFLIEGKGIIGYLKNIGSLRQYIKSSHYDCVHAHYSLCGFVASLSTRKPLVVSLMGSDLEINRLFTITARFFSKYIWSHTILKSEEMAKKLNIDREYFTILPNGVDIDKFTSKDQDWCKQQLNWSEKGYHILFGANPKRAVKNYSLFDHAVTDLKQKGYEIQTHVLNDLPHEQIPKYMNAADVVCLTSKREGSPNVIKEAMACNRPIVTTKVGDVNWLLNGLKGNYISECKTHEFSNQLEKAIKYSSKNKETKGRDSLLNKGLDKVTVSEKLLQIYKNLF